MRKCPFCNEVIYEHVIICRYCGQRVSGIQSPRRFSPLSVMVIILLGILLVATGALISQRIQEAQRMADIPMVPTATVDISTTYNAYQMCKQFAMEQLKAPKTADFQSLSDAQVVEYERDRFEAIAFVDAENNFGASLREHFICKVRYLGGDDWQLEELLFSN